MLLFVLRLLPWILLIPCSNCLFAQYSRITTIAGNGMKDTMQAEGPATGIALANPFGIQEMTDGSLIIASFDWDVLYRLDSDYQRLELIAGSGRRGLAGDDSAPAKSIEMNQPHELQIDQAGNIYVADTMNHRVGRVSIETGQWDVVAGTGQAGFTGDGGPARHAAFNQAYSIALDDHLLFVVDLKNQRLRQIDLKSGLTSTICGTGVSQLPIDGGLAQEQPLADPRSIAIDDNNVWIVLRGGNSVWRLDRSDGRIYHVAGTGKKGFSGDGGDAKLATFNGPKGIAVSPGKSLFIADTENHVIRQIDLNTGLIETLVGSPSGQAGFNGDGPDLPQRLLNRPHGLCLLKCGNLAIGDSENHRVRLLVLESETSKPD